MPWIRFLLYMVDLEKAMPVRVRSGITPDRFIGFNSLARQYYEVIYDLFQTEIL